MALIGRIRKNSWLLILVIGLALFAFVIMDMTGQGGPGAGDLTIVEVDGEKTDYTEFQNSERILYSGGGTDVFSARNYLYNYYVDKSLIGKEAEINGLHVPVPELMDRQFGENLSGLVQARFTDPNTGQVSREQLNGIKQAIDAGQLTPQLRELWAHQEKEVISERLTDKIVNMVSKGLYTPTWMVERLNQDQQSRTDFAFVKIPFDEVPEADVLVSDSEIKEYLRNNASEYRVDEETRKIDFASFSVEATGSDSLKLEEDLTLLADQFRTAENDTIFVENNYGIFDRAYVAQSTLSPVIADSVFNLPLGSVYGPYIDPVDNSYKAVKVRDRKIIPDSVRVRHILREVNTQADLVPTINLLDSIKGAIESGSVSFDSMAVKYSQGSLSVTLAGGDLGWNTNGAYVKPFNDLVFFDAEPGKLYTVPTQFGIHLLEVTDSKSDSKTEGVQVAYLTSPIIPSQETQDIVYEKVLNLVGANRRIEDLRAAMTEEGVTIQTSTEFTENDFNIAALGSGQTSRDIIRWAFDPSTEIGDVSPEVFIYQEPTLYYNKNYVIASLNQINPEGEAVFDNVKETISGILQNKKRADVMANQIGDQRDLSALASEYNVSIDTARGVNFGTDFIAGLGEEPTVAMAAGRMNLNETSAPIKGDFGVYLIQPFNRPAASADPNIAQLRSTFTSQITNQAKAGVLGSLRKQAKITDLRSTYY